ncbi:MAG: hypothetical protein H6667_17960 [Ardenticatenaceae bacterium]|nr:hypothetical protein [Ardenticatenaceae bacterium]
MTISRANTPVLTGQRIGLQAVFNDLEGVSGQGRPGTYGRDKVWETGDLAVSIKLMFKHPFSGGERHHNSGVGFAEALVCGAD